MRIAAMLPGSLFGRLYAAVGLSIAAVLLVIVALVLQDRREFAAQAGAWDPTHAWEPGVHIVRMTRELAALPASERAERVRDLQERPLLKPPPPEGAASGAASSDVRARLRASVAAALGGSYRVEVEPVQPEDAGVVRLPLRQLRAGGAQSGPPRRPLYDVRVWMPQGDSVVFRVDPPRPAPPLQSRLMFDLLALTLLLGILLFLITRRLTRPLTALAQAADVMGRSPTAPPLPERGTREVREATRAFNALHERLRRYLDSRTKVLAAMSHDLRTPLMRLRLRVELVEDAKLGEELQGDLDEMERMVRSALELFAGLNVEEPSAALDVNALLAGLREDFGARGGHMSIEGRARAPFEAHPLALKRCLTNLIDNAVKFGDPVTVRVEDAAELVIRVLDEGPGIPPDSLERVFEPFARVEASRNRVTGGTGLGLGIARDIAQMHGGTLVLVNRPQRGLEARLTLPRQAARPGLQRAAGLKVANQNSAPPVPAGAR